MAGRNFASIQPSTALAALPAGITGLSARHQSKREPFDPLHRIARGAPCRGADLRQNFGARPVEITGKIARQRIEIAQAQIERQRTMQRGVLRLDIGTRQSRDRDHKIVELRWLRRSPEHMQAVADLHFLEIAQMRIERPQGVVGRRLSRDIDIGIEPLRARQRQNVFGDDGRALRIEIGGQRIFIDQGFQPRQIVMQFGAGHRRRQMIDDHGGGAALGLNAFAGIVDNEGIEMRQRAQHRVRHAIRRQANAFTRQPFEIAVLAEMHDGVGVEVAPDPEVKRQIMVRRHQIGIVIGALGIDVVAARGLNADDDVTEAVQPKPKTAFDDMRILLRAAPTRFDGALHTIRQFRERGLIIDDPPRRAALASTRAPSALVGPA